MSLNKVRGNLYIGSWPAAKHDILLYNGITAVLDVAYDSAYVQYHPHEFRYVMVNLGDDHLNKRYMLDLAVDTLGKMLDNGETALVHCVAGASRSAYVVIKYLSIVENRSREDVFEEVHKIRKQVLWGLPFMSEGE